MSLQQFLLIISTTIPLIQQISTLPTIETNEIDTRTTDDDVIDLSHFGDEIFGSPKPEIGEKLANWHENHTQNPEEFGEYFEGDILFPKHVTRNGLTDKSTRWKDGVVPYEIAAIYPPNDIAMIQKAIAVYHKYTCIKFRPRLPTDQDYLAIVNGNTGCWSSVGRISGRQEVNLQSPYCTTKIGTPMHELMHALGFTHEQNRWERDSYVSIIWGNIKSGHDNNFKKADKDTIYAFGVPYDYRSVLHYSPTAFTINGEPTIVPKDPSKSAKMGQRDGFSRGDIEKLNAMYGCPKKDLNNNNNADNSGGNKGGGLLSFLFELVS